ncbi:hypothetical protein HQ545_03305 [Candidatus Woesearchaeota archaeon]|nr:hypothetical protein [Candidatus Woesearchaeota archaeon]
MKKKTNPIYVIFIGILIMATTAYADYEYISDSDILTASMVNQDPDTAIAGNVVELRIGVENWGSKPAESYHVEIMLEYPFQALPGEEYVKETGMLQGFQTDEDQKIVKFKLRTDRDTTQGSYDLNILIYKTGERDFTAIKKTLSVDISNRESAEVIYIDKVKLMPGKQTPIEFTINNVGRAPLRDMSFSWSNEDDVVLPVGSSDTKYVKYLGVGETTTITYDVIADTNADPGLYKLELSLTYEDTVTGELTGITNNAGVYVGGETDFEIAFSDSSASETSFSVANIGSNPASSVSVIVPEQPGWSVIGPNSMIIGNLNKGDYTVASFKLQRTGSLGSARTPSREEMTNMTDEELSEIRQKKAGSADANTINVIVAYTDTMGERDNIEKQVKMGTENNMTSTMAGMRARGIQQQGLLSQYKWYIIGIVALIALIFFYKKYKAYKLQNPIFNIRKSFRKKVRKLRR